LGLVKRWGPERVEAACARALEAEAVSVPLIGRMIERATEADTIEAPATSAATPARFARDAEHFATAKHTRGHGQAERLDATGGVA
jgi:hypothetical protein